MNITTMGCQILQEKQYRIDGNTGLSFSFMEGNSPFFKTSQELADYYNNLPNKNKFKHITKSNGDMLLVTYYHCIALETGLMIITKLKEKYYVLMNLVCSI